MKKIILVLFLVVITGMTSVKKSYALFGAGDIVFDPAAVAQMVTSYSKDVVNTAATVNTAMFSNIKHINENVLTPMNNVLIMRAILADKKRTQALVTGAMGQENALLVSNPGQYLQNKRNNITRQAVGGLVQQGGPSSNSALTIIIQRAKFSNQDLSGKINTLNQSNIPKLEQQRRCTDQALSRQAESDIKNSGATFTEEAYIARKRELNNALCGDLNDPRTQAALLAVNKQDPSLDSFLAMTAGCDNDFCRGSRIAQVIEDRQQESDAAAIRDLEQGGGIRSLTTCTKRVETKLDGTRFEAGDLSAPCISEEIERGSAAISAAFKESFDNVKPQLALIGNNLGGIMGTVAAAMTTISLVQQISDQTGWGDGTGGTGNTGGYTNDLLGDDTGKKNLTKTPLDYLSQEKSALSQLSGWQASHLSSIETEKAEMDTMLACYQTLALDFPEDRYLDQPVLAAKNFYNTYYSREYSGTESTRGKLLAEQIKRETKNTLIDQTISKINASNSTAEILSIFNGFQDTAKTQNLPEGLTAAAVEQGDYLNHKATLEQSLQFGDLKTYNTKCQTERNNAIHRQGGYGG